jgi:hypothetical protein
MKKGLLLLWFLGILQLCSIFGEGFEMPPHNPDMITYFQEVSLSHLKYLNYEKGTTIPFYGSGFFDAFNLSNLDDAVGLIETSAGAYIRINDYFYVPLSFSVTGNYVEKGYDGEILFGTGLVLRTSLITLGLYGGYDIHSYEVDRDGDGIENREFVHDFKFAMVPVINTQKYPIAGYFLESIFGFIGTGQKEFKPESYSINLGFIPFRLGGLKFNGLTPYHANEWYNREAKNKMYGCKLNITSDNLDKLELLFDSGYRDYYNIQGNQQFYEDTFYLQLGILRHDFRIFGLDFFEGAGLSIIFDRQNLFPPGFLITLDMNNRNLVNHDFFIWRFFTGFKSSNGGALSFGLTMILGGNSERKKYPNLWWLL